MAGVDSVVEIDFEVHLEGETPSEKEHQELRTLLRHVPRFAELKDDDFQFRQLHGGLTNKLTKVKILSLKETVLVRMYGLGSDLLIDREKENKMLRVLGEAGLAQPLLIEFKNGIVYRFTKGTPLDRFKALELPKEVANEVAKWHSAKVQLPDYDEDLTESNELSLKLSLEGHGQEEPHAPLTPSRAGIHQHAYLPHGGAIWSNIQNWLVLATKVPNKTGVDLDWDLLKEQVGDIKARLGTSKFTGRLVVSHNDLLPGNIIYNEEKKCVTFIDMEYCAQNPAGFDIANHFAELGNDYEVLKMDENPVQSIRYAFYKQYFTEMERLGGEHVDLSEENLEIIDKEIFLWKILAHIRWVFWSVIQGHHSDIEFDYGKFAQMRFDEYTKMYKSLS